MPVSIENAPGRLSGWVSSCATRRRREVCAVSTACTAKRGLRTPSKPTDHACGSPCCTARSCSRCSGGSFPSMWTSTSPRFELGGCIFFEDPSPRPTDHPSITLPNQDFLDRIIISYKECSFRLRVRRATAFTGECLRGGLCFRRTCPRAVCSASASNSRWTGAAGSRSDWRGAQSDWAVQGSLRRARECRCCCLWAAGSAACRRGTGPDGGTRRRRWRESRATVDGRQAERKQHATRLSWTGVGPSSAATPCGLLLGSFWRSRGSATTEAISGE